MFLNAKTKRTSYLHLRKQYNNILKSQFMTFLIFNNIIDLCCIICMLSLWSCREAQRWLDL